MSISTHGRLGKTQTLATSATPNVATAIGPQTYAIRLCATTACLITIGDAVGVYLPANWPEVLQTSPGQVLSVVEFSTTGELFLNELE